MFFRRYFCNQFCTRKEILIDLDDWDRCKGKLPDASALEKLPVYVSVDLSATTDLTSVCAVYPVNERYYVKSYNFVPRATVEKREKHNMRDYSLFAQHGDLTLIDGNCMDYELVRKCIKSIPGDVQMIVFDKWSSLETSQYLAKDGYDILQFPQTHTYFNEPTRKLERLVQDRLIIHDGDLTLRWCINNMQPNIDAKGLIKPAKASEHTKIDAGITLIMSLSQAMQHTARKLLPRSVYDSCGITVL